MPAYDVLAQQPMLDPLTAAVRQGDRGAVEQMLQKGASAGVADAYGQTPLMYAVHNRDFEMAEMLLSKGAEANVVNAYQVTPLKLAYYQNDASIARLLLQHGADARGFDASEWRELQSRMAVSHGQYSRAPRQTVNNTAGGSAAGSAGSWVKPVLIVGAVSAVVAGVAIAATSSDSNDGNSGSFDPQNPPNQPPPISTPPGGGNPSNPPVSTFDTLEFQAQAGLAQINASDAYAAGYTGTGAVVAVIDSGVDLNHPDLAANLVSDGQDFFDSGTADPKGQGIGRSHGTSVAGVIAAVKNDSGMHGVAYDAQILPIRAGDSTGVVGDLEDTVIANAYNYATAQGADVANGSFAAIVPITDPLISEDFLTAVMPNQIAAHQDGVDAGMIHVFPTGNESSTQPALEPGLPVYFSDLQPLWLAVGSVDASNNLSSFSNHCGVAQDWCLVAPGENIYTTVDLLDFQDTGRNGNYTTVSGTSFSTPHVAGAVAVLKQAFPTLTPAQIVQILLTTATDLGAPGVDAVYGHGLLNLDAATQPQQGTFVSLGTSLAGVQAELGSTALHLSPAFGDASAGFMGEFMILDGYQRAYYMPVSRMAMTKSSAFDRSRAFLEFGQQRYRHTAQLSEGVKLSHDPAEKQRFHDTPVTEEQTGRYAFSAELDTHTVTAHHRVAASEALGFDSALGYDASHRIGQDTLTNPYLALVDSSTSMGDTIQIHKKLRAHIGAFSGDMQDEAGNHDASGWTAGLSYSPEESLTLGLQGGTMQEQDTFLGSQSGGAMALQEGSTTHFAGVYGAWKALPSVTLHGSYMVGQSDIAPTQHSLVQEFSGVTSESFSMGATLHDVAGPGHEAGIALSQPLRVTKASATLDVPVARDMAGNITRTQQTVDLAPKGREMDIEGFYSLPLEGGTDVTLGGMVRFEPDHQQKADPDGLLMLKYNTPF